MRRLTLCLPYYRNRGMLALYLQLLGSFPANLKNQLAVIVVDDGSPDGDALGRDIGMPLAIFKIGVDIRWNQDAAKNIAAYHAETEWLLLTDIDHIVPQRTFEAIFKGHLVKSVVYRFSRVTMEDAQSPDELEPYKPHPNSWLMTRVMFDRVGGYDERFAGFYGTDAEFRDRVQANAHVVMRPDVLVRVPRTAIPDASTVHYLRKQPEDAAGIPRVKAERAKNPNWKPLRLSFPYQQIYP